MNPLEGLVLLVACAPVFILTLAFANMVIQTWLGSDDDAD